MRDHFLAHHEPKRVLKLCLLNENVMFGIQARRRLRRFEIKREPLLYSFHAGAMREIEKQREVEAKRRSEDRITTKEIDLDLHLVPEPSEDIDVVPAFLVVTSRRIVVDPNDVRKTFV